MKDGLRPHRYQRGGAHAIPSDPLGVSQSSGSKTHFRAGVVSDVG